MAGASSIEWTDETWNPVRGCSRISAGCANCYAEKIAARFSQPTGRAQWGRGFAILDDRGARWTGKVELVESEILWPIRKRDAKRVFVNSTSDLFHEDLSAENAISRVFASMALAPRQTFQVLTKRAERMAEVMNDPAFKAEVAGRASALSLELRGVPVLRADEMPWPLPNVWLGVSVEHQAAADLRIPKLRATPAAVRFLSCEPLLEQLDLTWHLSHGHAVPPVDWLIVGGESGHGARPMESKWARALVQQASAADVAPFVKQLGSVLGGRDHKNIDTFPADLRVREFPRA